VTKFWRDNIECRISTVREEDIAMDLTFEGWKGADRIDLTLDTDVWQGVVHTTMKLQTSLRSGLE
jgi:hypothetical protein